MSELLNTNLFSLEEAEENDAWLTARGSHVPETVEYGISSFVYKSETPFPKKILHFIEKKQILF